ncbi:glutamate-5-semialdehyde dehydrogenase [Vagococcus sp. JNUCC 83]
MSLLEKLGQNAKKAAFFLNNTTTKAKNTALKSIVAHLDKEMENILSANKKDIELAKENGIAESMIDRLLLTKERIYSMQQDINTTIELDDPIGKVDHMWRNEDNLLIGKQRVPIGVIGMIYESRPNVTTDASSLALKSGNAIILRGGKEAFYSNQALVTAIQKGLEAVDFPKECVQFIDDTSRDTATKFMQLSDYLDVLIPRGGANLIQSVIKNATVPVIETGTGNCHVYVDEHADLEMAKNIVINGKCQRPSVCNATESLLIHKAVAKNFLDLVTPELEKNNVELRVDKDALTFIPSATLATEDDFSTEFNDLILSIKLVDDLEEAINHINQYGTKHSEVIVTDSYHHSQKFMQQIDAAVVYVNASSRFTDGSVFGFGGEIGISTQKLHARGPMGLNELTTTKYIVFGEGQIRH